MKSIFEKWQCLFILQLSGEAITKRNDPNVLPNTNRIPPTPFRNMIVATTCRTCNENFNQKAKYKQKN